MDNKLLLVVATLALAATAGFMSMNQTPLDMTNDFQNFKSKYGKTYEAEEEAYRFAVYVQNMMKINEHNSKSDETYTMAENHLQDLTNEEFKAFYLGYKPAERTNKVVHYSETSNGSVDWVKAGKVQAVKDQGQCGSCWAFSAMAASESQQAVNGGPLESFAEQQLVDCDSVDSGCNGGLMDNAFQYLEGAGYCLESSYKYTAADGSCKVSSCTKSAYKITGYTDVSAGSYSSLTSALDGQPMAVAVDANNWSAYSSGIFSNCGTSLDHGVTAVAYGSGFTTIKNSWGASWGESGFIRIKDGNTCGVANAASHPHA